MATATKSKPTTRKRARLDTYLLVWVLDRSGSMGACWRSTIDGFNSFMHEQRGAKGTAAFLSLVLFDEAAGEPACQIQYQGLPIAKAPDLSSETYVPRGNTPLYDAVGETILATERIASTYDHVLFIIQTDGQENASREYTQHTLYELVGRKRAAGWDFMFMGANIDAYQVSTTMNVPHANTMSYDSAIHTSKAFASASLGTLQYRSTGSASGGAVAPITGAPVARPGKAPKPAKGTPVEPSHDDPGWLH